MAENLTGGFDVVAQFALAAVNRVLAAMHRDQRFPHSLTLRIEDVPVGSKINRPTVVSSVGASGDATVNQNLIGRPILISGQLYAIDPSLALLGGIVNPNIGGIVVPPIIPSHLKGAAQLQISAPRLDFFDTLG